MLITNNVNYSITNERYDTLDTIQNNKRFILIEPMYDGFNYNITVMNISNYIGKALFTSTQECKSYQNIYHCVGTGTLKTPGEFSVRNINLDSEVLVDDVSYGNLNRNTSRYLDISYSKVFVNETPNIRFYNHEQQHINEQKYSRGYYTDYMLEREESRERLRFRDIIDPDNTNVIFSHKSNLYSTDLTVLNPVKEDLMENDMEVNMWIMGSIAELIISLQIQEISFMFDSKDCTFKHAKSKTFDNFINPLDSHMRQQLIKSSINKFIDNINSMKYAIFNFDFVLFVKSSISTVTVKIIGMGEYNITFDIGRFRNDLHYDAEDSICSYRVK